MSLEVVLHSSPMGTLDVWIIERRRGSTAIAKPVELEFVEHDPMLVVDPVDGPTLRLDGYVALDFLEAWAKALAERGVKTDSDHKLLGTLDATRSHLADLQALLGLRAKPVT